MSTYKVDLQPQEVKFIRAALSQLAQASKASVEDQAYFMYLNAQLEGKREFNLNQLSLLEQLCSQSMSAGEAAVNRTDDIEVRIRAKAVLGAFSTIKAKIDIGIQGLQDLAKETDKPEPAGLGVINTTVKQETKDTTDGIQ